MRVEVATDLTRSAEAFAFSVWPVIGPMLGGGQLVSVESVAAIDFAKQLDVLAGIDAWQIQSNARLRGLASRVQWVTGNPYNTFTIRKSRTSGATTEYEKRLKAINNPRAGWLFPALTVQAYIATGTDRLLSAAGISTCDLFNFIANGTPQDHYTIRTNSQDGNEFIVVDWATLRRFDVKVVVAAETTMRIDLPEKNPK